MYPLQGQESDENVLQTKIDLEVKEKSLEDILHKISQKYDIRFSYNPQSIPTEKKITLSFKDVSLQKTLDAILQDTPVKYEIVGGYIILTEDQSKSKSEEDLISSGRVFSQSDSLPLPLVHIYFVKDFAGTVSDYEGYFHINFKDHQPQDTLTFSMVGYQSYYIQLKTLISEDEFELYLADSVYVLEDIAIEGKQSKFRAFFQELKLGKRVKFMFKNLKVKIKRLFASIDIPGIKEKIALRLRIKQLIEELQILIQELKMDKDEKRVRKIMEQIDELYKYI